MAANINPIYSLVPHVSGVAPSAANTNSDGTGTVATNIFVAFSAGANGSWISKIRWTPVATVASTATTNTMGRAFYSTVNSGATTPGTNTFQLSEVSLASQTVDQATNNPANYIEIPLNIAIPSGGYILVTNHAAPATSSAWQCTVFGGDY